MNSLKKKKPAKLIYFGFIKSKEKTKNNKLIYQIPNKAVGLRRLFNATFPRFDSSSSRHHNGSIDDLSNYVSKY